MNRGFSELLLVIFLILLSSFKWNQVEGACITDAFFPNTTSFDPVLNPELPLGVHRNLTLCLPNFNAFFRFRPPEVGVLQLTLTWPKTPTLVNFDVRLGDDFGPFISSFGVQDPFNPSFQVTEERLTVAVNPGVINTFAIDLIGSNQLDTELEGTFTLNLTLDTSRSTPCFTDSFSNTNNIVTPFAPPVYAPLAIGETAEAISVCSGNGRGFLTAVPASEFGYNISVAFTSPDNLFAARIVLFNNFDQFITQTPDEPIQNPVELFVPAPVITELRFVVSDTRSGDGSITVRVLDNAPPPLPPPAPIIPPEDNTITIVASVSTVAFLLLIGGIIAAIVILRKRGYFKKTKAPEPDNNVDQNQPRASKLASPVIVVSQSDIIHPSQVSAPGILKKYEIDYRELEDMTPIGKGSFGVVFQAKWREINVAVKQLNSAMLLDEKALSDFKSEAEILSSLRSHPNVIMFYGITSPPQPTTIVAEFCGNGSLYQLIASDAKISVELQFKILNGIARGMHHLHSENIIHRDLAARNILLTANFDAKVADFGMSREKQADAQKTKSDVGPLKWMAPEAIKEKVYSTKSDVYSFAITMWELLARDVPYSTLDPVSAGMKVVYEDLRPLIPGNAEKLLTELMVRCWAKEPEKRPSFKEICSIIQNSSKDHGTVNDLSDAKSISPSTSLGPNSPNSKANTNASGNKIPVGRPTISVTKPDPDLIYGKTSSNPNIMKGGAENAYTSLHTNSANSSAQNLPLMEHAQGQNYAKSANVVPPRIVNPSNQYTGMPT